MRAQRSWTLAAVLIGLACVGCGKPTPRARIADVEQSIMKRMRAERGVVIQEFDLLYAEDGSIVGTAKAESGERYDITSAVKDGKFEWQAELSLPDVETKLRIGLEPYLGRATASIRLRRTGPAEYVGIVEFADGSALGIHASDAGGKCTWQLFAEPPGE